ncbi:Reverse transcriptase [Theobroma cacao]|nr:Reverse transcriptase [Theobroma cacao]
MQCELKALEDNATWRTVPLPSNSHAVGCKLMFKVKINANGTMERYKARLLDISNAFLNGDLDEVVYMDLPQDYSLFTMTSIQRDFIALLVYVDDIVIASINAQLTNQEKKYMSSQFKLRDLGTVKYFLRFEIARGPKGISISQKNYTLDLLDEYGLLGTKLVTTPIDYSHKLIKDIDRIEVANPTRYK